ncbi:MAG: hypothetical protein ABSG68_19410 [Thermoguttaceae bacterium]|jgi:hypothetical protein
MILSPDSPSRPRRAPLAPPRYRSRRFGPAYLGHAQLSLVEHALCPLDAGASLRGPYVHETQYWYSDKNRHRKQAQVRVTCPDGLSPADEFYLWGLLSLTFSQPQPTADFYATPYYCLRQLGLINGAANRGGKNYDLFRGAINRLSTVSYRNDHFFDPIRGEHRDVGFGFFSYSLPLDPGSSRAWRIAWDPIFFEFCSAVRGALLFDFRSYRRLDEASRRLYLLLRKIFWRNEVSPVFDLHDLAVHTIGFSATHETYELKRKLWPCMERLLKEGIIRLPPGIADIRDLCTKKAKARYSVQFHRGPHFDQATPDAMTTNPTDSSLYEPLATIGFDPPAIRRILTAYDPRLVAECADMTLAAKERFGPKFFKKSPQAYFMDNIQEQSKGKRTSPDWWRMLRAEEERRRRESVHHDQPADDRCEKKFREYLETEAREAFEQIMSRVFQDLKTAGQPDDTAKQNARHLTETHFRNRFFKEHTELRGDGPTPLRDALRHR